MNQPVASPHLHDQHHFFPQPDATYRVASTATTMSFPRFIVLTTLLASALGNAVGQVCPAPVAAAPSPMDTVMQRLGAAFMRQAGRVGLSVGITRNGRCGVQFVPSWRLGLGVWLGARLGV